MYLVSKRIFDLFFSLIGIIFLSPIMIISSILIKINSKGPIIFKQKRVGLKGKSFLIFKFRTMDNDIQGGFLTLKNDKRVTSIGRKLRKYKLDELPQLFNVFIGNMSFVGPRPEVEKYVKLYNKKQKKVLDVKPGITDYASIEFVNENELLANFENSDQMYIENIMPRKIELNLKYLEEKSLINDILIIIKTLRAIVK